MVSFHVTVFINNYLFYCSALCVILLIFILTGTAYDGLRALWENNSQEQDINPGKYKLTENNKGSDKSDDLIKAEDGQAVEKNSTIEGRAANGYSELDGGDKGKTMDVFIVEQNGKMETNSPVHYEANGDSMIKAEGFQTVSFSNPKSFETGEYPKSNQQYKKLKIGETFILVFHSIVRALMNIVYQRN